MKVLTIILCYFKVFGISSWHPFDPHNKTTEGYLFLWKGFHLLVAFLLLISNIYISYTIFDKKSPTTSLTYAFQFIMPCITHHTILIESFYHNKTQRIIWAFPQNLSGHLSHLGFDIDPMLHDALWRFLIQMIFVQGISFSSELIVIYGLSQGHISEDLLYYGLLKLLPFSMSRISLLFHGLFVTYIDTYMKSIITEIHYVGTLSKRKFFQTNETQLISKLMILKTTYKDLAVMNQRVNETFALSHMMNILSIFITLTANIYWICAELRLGTNHFVVTVLSPLGTIIAFIYITMLCQKSLKLMINVPHELNRIEMRKQQHQLINVVHGFKLQIQHQPITHSAGSLFDMDAILLKDVFAFIVTFVIIFVQFIKT